ncbi:MAG TPA: FAD-dependent oxidoreductase [Capillimicrobium sp.]|nr:FAD-dependent oxidoreductase [Capillimicrobium sp.]
MIGPVYWLEQALARENGAAAACPPLTGVVRADVCIVGGGFVGMWTALEIAERAPDASVVLLDAEGCGFGASGRNGGWATSWFDELHELVERFGPEHGAWLAEQSSAAIDRIAALCEEEEIDCHLRRSGSLWTATAEAQLRAIDAPIAAGEAVGRPGFVRRLTAAELRARTGSPVVIGGALLTDAAAVQPALLARGMRRALLRRGVRIHEGTPMISLERSAPAIVRTPAGSVEAGQVVLALGAWAARLRELRRAVVPIGSHIVLTEPIPERIAELGWTGGELLGDTRLLVHYAQVTRDGRIAFGRGGGAVGSFGRVLPRHTVDPRTVSVVADGFRRWFPQLADVRLTHAWGGAVDRAPGHLPFAGSLGDHGNVHYATGFSGNGVAPSALLGRVLGRLALGVRDEYTACGLVGGPPGYLPPEPLRSLGGAVVRRATERAEAAEERGRRADPVSRALRRLVFFTLPRAVEPRAWRSRALRGEG